MQRYRIFQIDKLYQKGKIQGTSFPHFREDRAITKDEEYPQNPAKQAKARDFEKQIDPVRCSCAVRRLPSNGILSNGVDRMVYKLYDLTPDEIAIVEGKI